MILFSSFVTHNKNQHCKVFLLWITKVIDFLKKNVENLMNKLSFEMANDLFLVF